MGKVTVTISGKGMGILLHNPAGSAHFQTGPKTALKKSIPTPEEEAAAGLYWTADKKSVGFPAWNILQGLVRAASGCKLPSNKKKPLAPIIAGDLTLEPEIIPFKTKEYEIDIRRAVVQHQGILRSRAKLRNWTLTFTVTWEEQYLGPGFGKNELRELLDTLGGSIGIGDFRPEKRGPFGKFTVVEIK